MTRLAALAMAIVSAVVLLNLALKHHTPPLILIGLAALALISIIATATLVHSRRLADRAYQRGYYDASNS